MEAYYSYKICSIPAKELWKNSLHTSSTELLASHHENWFNVQYATEPNSQHNWIDPPKVLRWHHERHRKSCCATVIMASGKEHERRTLCMLWCNWSYPSYYLSAGMDRSRKGAQGQAEPYSQNLQNEKSFGNFCFINPCVCPLYLGITCIFKFKGMSHFLVKSNFYQICQT